MSEEAFDEQFAEWEREMEREIQRTVESERLTAEDFAVCINARSDDFDIVPLRSHEKVNVRPR